MLVNTKHIVGYLRYVKLNSGVHMVMQESEHNKFWIQAQMQWFWWEITNLTEDNQFSFITKGSIYYIKHVWIQLSSMGVDWSEIVRLVEVSAMCYKITYCILTLYGIISKY